MPHQDLFARDSSNGRGTSLPVLLSWEADESNGFLLDSGFTCLVSNGSSDCQDLYTLFNISVGNGLFTVQSVLRIDAGRLRNNQQNGFQFGLNVSGQSPAFTVRTRVHQPFAGIAAPKVFQLMGF